MLKENGRGALIELGALFYPLQPFKEEGMIFIEIQPLLSQRSIHIAVAYCQIRALKKYPVSFCFNKAFYF